VGGVDVGVTSAPIALVDDGPHLAIRGRLDALVACDDGTTGIIDFKTTEPKFDHLAPYARQLHAYAVALERPARSTPAAVSKLGLLCFGPDAFEIVYGRAKLVGGVEWIEIDRDDEAFFPFLTRVVAVLAQGSPPPAGEHCPWCAWRGSVRARPQHVVVRSPFYPI
jgi:hypothetical protein